MDALIGHTVGGRFHITGRIARGGMACVYTATQAHLNRPVAIKVLRSKVASSESSSADFQRRFLQEAAILSRLQHPNLVTLLDYGQITELPGDHYYIAMEYLQGETLARRFRKQGRLGVAQSIRIARQIGRGLREVHRQGFIHRDLKPSNIMLVPEDDENDIVKLIDFGIGKVVVGSAADLLAEHEEPDATRVGLLLGSPRYMAPEQIRGEPVEPRTDLYGLGIILFQSLTGRVPFEAKTEVDTMLAHCSVPAPPLDAYMEEPTGSLTDLVADLLSKRPEERPTIHEFLARLSNVESELFDAVGLAGPTLFGSRSSFPPRDGSGAIRLPPPGNVPRLAPPPAWLISGVAPPPSDPPAGRSEPPTVVTTGSLASGMAPSVAPAAITEPLSGSVAPLAPAVAGSRFRFRAWYAVVPVVLLLAWLLFGKLQSSSSDSVESSGATTAATTSFLLSLDSDPSRAVVREEGTVLGQTPLKLAIERASVQGKTRRFTIEREGYEPFTHEQSDSSKDVAALARLSTGPVPTSSAASQKSRRRDPAPRAAAPVEEKPTAVAPKPVERLDINLAR
jgi:serine/threonine protein kinase